MSIEYCWTSHMVTISNVFLQNQVSATVFTIDKEKFINNEYLNDISWIWTKTKQNKKKQSRTKDEFKCFEEFKGVKHLLFKWNRFLSLLSLYGFRDIGCILFDKNIRFTNDKILAMCGTGK